MCETKSVLLPVINLKCPKHFVFIQLKMNRIIQTACVFKWTTEQMHWCEGFSKQNIPNKVSVPLSSRMYGNLTCVSTDMSYGAFPLLTLACALLSWCATVLSKSLDFPLKLSGLVMPGLCFTVRAGRATTTMKQRDQRRNVEGKGTSGWCLWGAVEPPDCLPHPLCYPGTGKREEPGTDTWCSELFLFSL